MTEMCCNPPAGHSQPSGLTTAVVVIIEQLIFVRITIGIPDFREGLYVVFGTFCVAVFCSYQSLSRIFRPGLPWSPVHGGHEPMGANRFQSAGRKVRVEHV
jgi:hypothetical protein